MSLLSIVLSVVAESLPVETVTVMLIPVASVLVNFLGVSRKCSMIIRHLPDHALVIAYKLCRSVCVEMGPVIKHMFVEIIL